MITNTQSDFSSRLLGGGRRRVAISASSDQAGDALGWFEPIHGGRKLALAKPLPPGLVNSVKEFEKIISEKKEFARIFINEFETYVVYTLWGNPYALYNCNDFERLLAFLGQRYITSSATSKPPRMCRSSATPSVHTPAVPATVHETLAPDAVRRVSAPAAVRTPAAPAVTSASVPASVHAPLAPGSVSRNSASSAVSRNAAPSAVSRNLAPSTISSNLAPSAVSRNSALSAVTRNSAPTAVRKNSAPAAVSGNSVRRLSEPAAVPTSFAETPISTGLGRVRTLTQMHQELVHSQDLMCSGKEYFEDIRCGIEIAELISTDVDPRLCHNYFYKQLDHFRRSLEHMKCLIHQSDAKVHLLWRAAPPSLNALLKVFTTEYSILRELRRRFASVHKQIEGAGRQAYGLLKNCIPYEKRYDMPKIPLYDQIPSVFDPMPVKHTPITRILIPEFLRTQHKQVGSGELKGSTGGIFMPRNEKFLWSSLVKDTLNRHERAKRKKTESQKHRSPPKS